MHLHLDSFLSPFLPPFFLDAPHCFFFFETGRPPNLYFIMNNPPTFPSQVPGILGVCRVLGVFCFLQNILRPLLSTVSVADCILSMVQPMSSNRGRNPHDWCYHQEESDFPPAPFHFILHPGSCSTFCHFGLMCLVSGLLCSAYLGSPLKTHCTCHRFALFSY